MTALAVLLLLAILPWMGLLASCIYNREDGEPAVILSIVACAALAVSVWSFSSAFDTIKALSAGNVEAVRKE